ncbi:MAG: hypothetical protein ARM1_0477 [Candidatus Micrarchaeota archaeon]|nr:MAG: hypothetical protein ARM1_0477 [Candidatus Micrarchaeota archaeon]
MAEMVQKGSLIFFMVFWAVSIGFLVLSISIPKGQIYTIPLELIAVIIAILFAILAYGTRFHSPIIIEFLNQRKKLIVLNNDYPYYIYPSNDAIVRKLSSEYVATVIIKLPMYRSATEMSEEERYTFAKNIGRALTLSDKPVRFASQLYYMNNESYISVIREQLNKAETELLSLQQQNVPQEKIEKAKGQLAMWRNILSAVSSSNAMQLDSVVYVSAKGVRDYEAVAYAQQRAREIISGIGAIFGVIPTIVTGQDIIKYIEPEGVITEAIVTEKIKKEISD